jgi:hypothetical protein
MRNYCFLKIFFPIVSSYFCSASIKIHCTEELRSRKRPLVFASSKFLLHCGQRRKVAHICGRVFSLPLCGISGGRCERQKSAKSCQLLSPLLPPLTRQNQKASEPKGSGYRYQTGPSIFNTSTHRDFSLFVLLNMLNNT